MDQHDIRHISRAKRASQPPASDTPRTDLVDNMVTVDANERSREYRRIARDLERELAACRELHENGQRCLKSGKGALAEARVNLKRLSDDRAELLAALAACFDLLDRSDVRHFIGAKLGEQAALHAALNPARALLAKVQR